MQKKYDRNRTMVDVTCVDCGQSRSIRSDSFTVGTKIRCRPCSSRRNRPGPRTRKGVTLGCVFCGKEFYRHPGDVKRFCSHRCASDGKRRYKLEEHQCVSCGRKFQYSQKPYSNSSGNYCSRACRDRAYLGVVNGNPGHASKGERIGWRSRRDKFVRNGNDFCVICGVGSGRLHVHHIEGHRNVHYDDLTAVVTVCPKHHCALELITREIVSLPPRARREAALAVMAYLEELK